LRGRFVCGDVLLRGRFVAETFCSGDVLLGDILLRKLFLMETFCDGDVLSRSRFARKRFVCAPKQHLLVLQSGISISISKSVHCTQAYTHTNFKHKYVHQYGTNWKKI
jgi:hypothetical protein